MWEAKIKLIIYIYIGRDAELQGQKNTDKKHHRNLNIEKLNYN